MNRIGWKRLFFVGVSGVETSSTKKYSSQLPSVALLEQEMDGARSVGAKKKRERMSFPVHSCGFDYRRVPDYRICGLCKYKMLCVSLVSASLQEKAKQRYFSVSFFIQEFTVQTNTNSEL